MIHIPLFSEHSDKGTSTPWTSAPGLLLVRPDLPKISFVRLPISPLRRQSNQWAKRAALEWFLISKKELVSNVAMRRPSGECQCRLGPLNKSQSSLFRTYFCYFSSQYCHLYVVSPHRTFLEDWNHILSLCLLRSGGLCFKNKHIIQYARWEYNTPTCIISGWSDNNLCSNFFFLIMKGHYS